MATIQIRDIPDETYEVIRANARAAGQSLQAYMREHVVAFARHQSRKADMFAQMRELMSADGGSGVPVEEIVAARDAERR